MEDLSERELERYLSDSNAAKWFCDFDLTEATPDYSVFSKVRTKIGTNMLSKIFRLFREQLRSKGYMSEVFTFVDASHLISKANLWEERDEARKQRYEKLNNESLPKVAYDKQARIGCKGGNKFWYGYKKHVSVDIQSGLINKVAVTPANVTDAKGLAHVLPTSGAVYADKGYCVATAKVVAAGKGVHLCAIKKNNMKEKNFALDRYYISIRSPFERVFSQNNKRLRYIGIAKNQFTEFMNAICFKSSLRGAALVALMQSIFIRLFRWLTPPRNDTGYFSQLSNAMRKVNYIYSFNSLEIHFNLQTTLMTNIFIGNVGIIGNTIFHHVGFHS
jgi:IS5 family transposase